MSAWTGFGPHTVSYAAATAAFNDHGEAGPIIDMLHGACTADVDGEVIAGADSIRTRLERETAAGLVAHTPLAMLAGGPFLALTYRNSYADGRIVGGAAIARFEERDLVELIARREPLVAATARTDSLVARVCSAVTAFNGGDAAEAAALFSPHAVIRVGDRTVDSLGAVRFAVQRSRGRRASVRLDGLAAAGRHLVGVGRSRVEDDWIAGAALLRFDEAGHCDLALIAAGA